MAINLGIEIYYTSSDGIKKKLADELVSVENSVVLEEWIDDDELVELIDLIPPKPVTNLVATIINRTTIRLNWDYSLSSDAKQYSIYLDGVYVNTTPSNTFDITNLNYDTQYNVSVTTIDKYNNKSTSVSSLIRTGLAPRAIQFPGTNNNYISIPSMTYDSFEITMQLNAEKLGQFYFDARPDVTDGFMKREGTGNDTVLHFIVFVDGVAPTQSSFFPVSKKVVLQANAEYNEAKTGRLYVFGSSTGINCMKGILYDIKIYHNGNVVAHYDLSDYFVGTSIPDSSGNGRVATLYGGTWIYA